MIAEVGEANLPATVSFWPVGTRRHDRSKNGIKMGYHL